MTTIVINNNHCEIPNSYRNISPINSRSMNVSKELTFLSSSISSKKRLRAEEDDFADDGLNTDFLGGGIFDGLE